MRRTPVANNNPLIRQLYTHMYAQDMTLTEVAERAGVSRECLGRWKSVAANPSVFELAAAGKAVGLELIWKRINGAH